MDITKLLTKERHGCGIVPSTNGPLDHTAAPHREERFPFDFDAEIGIGFGVADSSLVCRQQMENFWCERLEVARKQHGFAVYRLRQFEELQLSQEGSVALDKIQAQELAAREEYKRVLKIFMDLTLDGKMPELEGPFGARG